MAQDIQNQLLPQTKALMDLKQHVATLYQKLGNTELQSWYKTLVEAGEFDQLGPIVSGMLAAQQNRAQDVEIDGDLDKAEASQADEINQLEAGPNRISSISIDDASSNQTQHCPKTSRVSEAQSTTKPAK